MADFRIIECEQGGAEWRAARMGIPTASMFKAVIRTAGRAADGSSESRRHYMRQLAGELITGRPVDRYVSEAMARGTRLEPEARRLYGFLRNCSERITVVGFVRSDMYGAGCSPDALVGDDRVLEIKTCDPHVMVAHIQNPSRPLNEHMAQCQGNAWLLRRPIVDLMLYCPGMEPIIRTIDRSDQYCTNLKNQVDVFNFDLRKLVKQIGKPSA